MNELEPEPVVLSQSNQKLKNANVVKEQEYDFFVLTYTNYYIDIVRWCTICLSGSENIKHMMFMCDRAKSVWQSMPQLRLNSGIWGSSYDDRMAPYL